MRQYEWTPFAPRRVAPLGILTVGDWRVKRYRLNCDRPVEFPSIPSLEQLIRRTLPNPAATPSRAGAAFALEHAGERLIYAVLCWWDNENELVTRVFIRAQSAEDWTAAGDAYSFCVWDLEVMWFERNAWIECMLGRGSGDVEAYLSRWLTVDV